MGARKGEGMKPKDTTSLLRHKFIISLLKCASEIIIMHYCEDIIPEEE